MKQKLYKISDINTPYITTAKKITIVNNTPVLQEVTGYSVSVRTMYGFIEKIIDAKNAMEAKKEFIKQYPQFI